MQDNQYWQKKWQIGDISFHRLEVNKNLITYFSQLNLQPDAAVLVPLCGKSLDMIWLAQQGYKVVGIELSEIGCRDFFAENEIEHQIFIEDNYTRYHSKNIDILCGDFFAITKKDLPAIQAVYDCKALIALPPEVRQKYVPHLLQLVEHLKILLIALEGRGKTQGAPYTVAAAEIKQLYGAQSDIAELARKKRATIEPHLIAKGFAEIIDVVYLIK